MENYKGVQPIRIFEQDLYSEFDDIKRALNTIYPDLGLTKISLDYQTGKHKIRGPKASKNTIHLDETFLSAFWNYCYGLTISTPLGNTDKGDTQKEFNPYDSLNYCSTLFSGYEDWNSRKIPNPENSTGSIKGIDNGIGKIYRIGVTYMLLHEFCHIIRDDISKSKSSRSENHKMEFACDTFAFNIMNQVSDIKTPEVVLGILCAIGLLTFASSFRERFTMFHPYPDDRLVNVMKGFETFVKIKENHNAWIISTWVLFSYDFLKNKKFPGSDDSIFRFEDMNLGSKQLFHKTRERLQDKKVW